MEWIAPCGCRLEIRREDGEPIYFHSRCEAHQDSSVTVDDVSGEVRAMSLCQKALSEYLNVDAGQVRAEIVGDDRHARAIGPDGEIVEFKKVTLAQYLEQHEGAVTRVRRA